MQGWTAYIAASVALVLSHAALSAPGVRPWMYQRLGRNGFYSVYTVISTAALAAFVAAFWGADRGPQLFASTAAGHIVAIALMPFAFIGVVARLSTRAQEGDGLLPPVGIYRITRAPGSLATVLWAGLHLLNMGDAKRFAAFAVMALIGLVALVKNEIVLARSDDPMAEVWRRQTSLVPMMALERNSLPDVLSEIGSLRIVAGLTAYVVALALHPIVFGRGPLTGLI